MASDWEDTTSIADRSQIGVPGVTRDRAYLITLSGSSVGEMFKVDAKELVIGRGTNADVRLLDDGISRLHVRVRLTPEGLHVEDLSSRNGTFINGEKITSQIMTDGDKLQLGRTTVLKFAYQDRHDESYQQRMLDSALRDPLTSAYNKRYFTDRLSSEFHFAARHRSQLAILLLDLDLFKTVNDTYGHLAGDRVLVAFANLLAQSIRNEDVLARYGGEEFVIVSRQIAQKNIMHFADRLRKQVEAMVVPYDGKSLRVTCSIGVATYPELQCEKPEQLVEASDRALYTAKSNGRNRVCLHPSEFDDQRTDVEGKGKSDKPTASPSKPDLAPPPNDEKPA
jgi:diguanylate cyclase (GGDEF)-like protein